VFKILSFIVLAPLALVIIVFSLNNRGSVVVDLWPAQLTYEVPVFSLMLVSLVVGVVWGGLASWISGGAHRKRAREATRRAEQAERDRQVFKDRAGRMENELEAIRAPTDQPALPAPRDAA